MQLLLLLCFVGLSVGFNITKPGSISVSGGGSQGEANAGASIDRAGISINVKGGIASSGADNSLINAFDDIANGIKCSIGGANNGINVSSLKGQTIGI